MQVPEGLFYTQDHEWARVDGQEITVGITDFAQSAIGDIVFVQLPTIGDSVSAGVAAAELESTKSVSEVYAPTSGQVVAVNDALAESPELINVDPYGEGWLFRLAGSPSPEWLGPDEYRGLIAKS